MFDDNEERRLANDLLEAIFRSCIEAGLVQIEEKSPSEIVNEFKDLMHQAIASGRDISLITDHRDELLERAKREASGGNLNVAVTFYALWIEHAVNGILIDGLRRKGYDKTVIDPLIRELKLSTKLTALWQVAEIPQIPDDDLRLINEISQFRNSFVHYKWRVLDEADEQSTRNRLKEIVERAGSLPTTFNAVTKGAFWNNREEEIIGALRKLP
jgi:hypothetical protein